MSDDIDEGQSEHAFREDRTDAVYPYSFLRETTAEALGLRFGNDLKEEDITRAPNPDYERRKKMERELGELTGKAAKSARAIKLAAEIEKLREEPATIVMTWKGRKRDTAIVLWVCSQPDSVCQKARAHPEDYESAVDKWADESGLRRPGPLQDKAILEFSRIMASRNQAKGAPDIERGKEEHDPNE